MSGLDHTIFIALAWAAAVLTVAALIVWVVLDHRAQKRALAALEPDERRRTP